MKEILGERIKSERIRLGLGQQELADAIGVHRSVVGHWEINSSHPNSNNLHRLAAFCNRDPSYFIDLENLPKIENVAKVSYKRLNNNQIQKFEKLSERLFGKNLKNARLRAGISATRLAGVTGIAESTIEYYERGRWLPTYQNLAKISLALNTSLDTLCGFTK